ncbi:hypothetical protein HOY80DRAFT_1001792 [Tuber brumale]|nr:hypothetical protein HOY80DRAFT_1001792 [Tuber brumale]
MHVQYRPFNPRTTFESVDPLHAQWDYLENSERPTTNNSSITSSQELSAATAAATATESAPVEARKREYILYSRRLVRRHISFTYSKLEKGLPRLEGFSGPQLVSALIRAGKDLDMVSKAKKKMNESTISLQHAVQYALCGEFITLEQATIRGCGPDATSAASSVAPSPPGAYPSPPPSAEDKEKKRVKAKEPKREDEPPGRTTNLTGDGPNQNLNTFSAKLLRLGYEESAIEEYFETLCEQQNKGNTTAATTTTPTTPRRTASSSSPLVSAAVSRYTPTSCRKPDTGTLPRALHSPENEFILPIPPLPLPNFVPTGRPLSLKRGSPRKRELSDPEASNKSKRSLSSPLPRVRRMLSWERKFDKALVLAQSNSKLPREPTLEFKSHWELDASGISGMLRPLKVYPDRADDWGQKYFEEQRDDLMATLETRAAISGGKVRRVPLPGSASPTKIRHRGRELRKGPEEGVKPSRLDPITPPDQQSSTTPGKDMAERGPLPQLSYSVVGSIMAYLKSPLTIFSKPPQAPFSAQLSTPTPTNNEVERKVLAELRQETAKALLIHAQTPPSSSKRKHLSMADAEDLENQNSPKPQKKLKAKPREPTSVPVSEIRRWPDSEAPGGVGRSCKNEQPERPKGLVRDTEKTTPAMAQTPPPSSSMIKLSPIANIQGLADPESPLLQKKRRIMQGKSTREKIGELPWKGNSESLSREVLSLGGVETASRPDFGNDEGATLQASDADTVDHQIPARVHRKRKRANSEYLSKYGKDFFHCAKRARTTQPLGLLSPFP